MLYSHEPSTCQPEPTHIVGENFPRSQHRPTIVEHAALIEFIQTAPLPRWNFRKADWLALKEQTACLPQEVPDPTLDDVDSAYKTFQEQVLRLPKAHIPRGFSKKYIPEWDGRCEVLTDAHTVS